MSNKQVLCYLLVAIILVTLLCGCQSPPVKDAIISKQSVTETALLDTVPSSSAADTNQEKVQEINFTNTFSSSDGSVAFTMDIHGETLALSPLVVQVEPHILTNEDARRVAETLFPDAVFYEAEPERDSVYSKDEIQEKLNRWAPYSSAASLEELYGEEADDDTAEVVKSFIEQYSLMYESAPATNPHTPCAWKMRKASEYSLPAEELVGVDLSNDSDEISVQFKADGIPYLLTTTSRDKSDFKVNMIACSIYDGLCPVNLDERIFFARLCRTEEPTQAQLDVVKQKAENILEDFNLGQWQIDECFYTSELYGNQTEYRISVNAVPAFDGIPALRRPQLTGLRNEDGYSARHYYSDVQFVFAPTGELISFTLTTPLEIQGMSAQDSLGAEQLITRAQEIMTLTDATAYGLGDLAQFIPEEALCKVTVSEIRCGLSRIKAPEQENCYYYVTSIAFYGTAEDLGVQTGKTYYYSEKPELLFLLNALDGSIIDDVIA